MIVFCVRDVTLALFSFRYSSFFLNPGETLRSKIVFGTKAGAFNESSGSPSRSFRCSRLKKIQ